jgi:hypothetical protein
MITSFIGYILNLDYMSRDLRHFVNGDQNEPMDIYKVVSWGPAVGIGVTGSTHLHLAAVGKANDTANPYYIVNEVISAEIGRRARLPIPPSCSVEDEDGRAFFASLNFNLTGDTLPPVIPPLFAQAFGSRCADVVVFDIFICNSDRHSGNLSADYSTGRFNLFDHSHAMLGYGPFGVDRLIAAENDLTIEGGSWGNRHCLMDQVTDDRHFSKILERIENLDEYFIRELVQEVVEYGLDNDQTAQITDFLLNRRSTVRQLIANNKSEFTGIQQWSLL